MNQNIRRIRVFDFNDANTRLKELREFPCYIKYTVPKNAINVNIFTFFDALINISSNQSYSKTVIVIFLAFFVNEGEVYDILSHRLNHL